VAKAKAEVQVNPGDFALRAIGEVEKKYGQGVIVTGQDHSDKPRVVIPWSPSLDAITSGGVQEGSWVGITGNPKTTKTAVALSLAARAQKPEYGSRPVFYANVEGRLSVPLLRGTQGLDLEKLTIIQSRSGQILTSQHYLNILEQILRTVPNAFILIDSISALCDERESTDGVGTETRGGGAKLISQFCRTMNQVVPVNNSIVVGITHLISNTSGMGAQYVERAARAWTYQCDYQLRTVQKTAWKADNRQVGLQIKWTCNASALGPPGMSIDSYVRFGLGIDRLYELVMLGSSSGMIRKSGSWLYLDCCPEDVGGEIPKFQGAERLTQALSERPDWVTVIENGLRSLGGQIAGDE
jgi:recombination protein RecA